MADAQKRPDCPGMRKQHPGAWAREGELLVSFYVPGPIPDPIWQAYCDAVADLRVEKVLATSVGSVEVTPVQRRNMAEVLQRRSLAIAVITDELLVRGLVTAVSWLGVQQLQAFPWRKLDAALDYLDPSVERTRVVARVDEVRRAVELGR